MGVSVVLRGGQKGDTATTCPAPSHTHHPSHSCGTCAFFTWDSLLGHCESVPGCGGVTSRNWPSAGTASPPPPPPPPSTPAPAAADAGDKPTPDGYTCAQQKEWGKCGEGWMVSDGFCRATCGGASSSPPPPAGGCTDNTPPGGYTCAQQKEWGKCGESWMVGFCDATCGRCGSNGRKLAGSSGSAAYGAILAGARSAKKVKGDDTDDALIEAAADNEDDVQRRKLAGSSGAAAYGAVLSGARRAKKVKGDDVDDVEAVSDDADDGQRRKLAGSSGAAAYGAVLSGARRAKKVKGDDVDDADIEAVADDNDGQRRKLAGSSGAAAYGAILAGARSAKKVKSDDTDDATTAIEATDPATRRRLAATDSIMDDAGGFQPRGSSSIGPVGAFGRGPSGGGATVARACADTAAPDGYSCAQQQAWGKCGEAWMAKYCAATCGRC